MIKKFWTITQKEEIERCCSEYEIPQDIMNITVRQSRQSGVARATCPD